LTNNDECRILPALSHGAWALMAVKFFYSVCRANLTKREKKRMSSKRLVMALLLAVVMGNLAGQVFAKPSTKDCYGCHGYCLLHPNSPRCL
jgi:hypothetical protein